MSSTMYFGGVEGGATHSNLVICDGAGQVLGTASGPGTNHWTLGIEACADRVIDMVHVAKASAGIPKDRPLDSLGLTLSGCEQDSSNAELAARVREKDPNCARAIYVASDTAGSLYTGAPEGGMVLIAGTGSNALLRTPDGEQRGCGGWGFLLGDEGSAYWVAHRAVKIVFDDMDGLKPSPYPIHNVWETIKEHFGVETRADLLPHAYKHFDKPQFASVTIKLAKLAYKGDALARHVFARAGAQLAAHAAALTPRTGAGGHYTSESTSRAGAGGHCTSESSSRAGAGGHCISESASRTGAGSPRRLRVVCVGSLWKSWELLKPGMLAELRERRVSTELELVQLKVSSAMGAVWLAAKHINYDLPRDDSAFCTIFYTYVPDFHTNGTNGKSNGTNEETNGTCNGTNEETNGTCNGTSENGANGNGSGSNGKCHAENEKYENGVKVNGVNEIAKEECGCY